MNQSLKLKPGPKPTKMIKWSTKLRPRAGLHCRILEFEMVFWDLPAYLHMVLLQTCDSPSSLVYVLPLFCRHGQSEHWIKTWLTRIQGIMPYCPLVSSSIADLPSAFLANSFHTTTQSALDVDPDHNMLSSMSFMEPGSKTAQNDGHRRKVHIHSMWVLSCFYSFSTPN